MVPERSNNKTINPANPATACNQLTLKTRVLAELPWVISICIVKLLAVNSKPPPVTPNAMRIQEALNSSAPLAQLAQLMRESNARFDAIRNSLPAALAAHVKPGPLDAEGWSLLAANASVAAKLRQLQPRLEEVLKADGWQVTAIRIKVQSS
jgi:hypothetical protein